MKIIIVGAGGFGREVFSLIKNINQVKPTFHVLGFADDALPVGTPIQDRKVLCNIADLAHTKAEAVVVAIGNSQVREAVTNKLPAHLKKPNIIHPLAVFQDADRITIGKGCIICAGNIFTTDVAIGNFCVVNLSCTIGHDAVLEDFTSIMPGVNISGGAHLKRGTYVGTGAKLIKATTVGQYSKIGAGAVVDCDVEENETVVGVPAKPIKKTNG